VLFQLINSSCALTITAFGNIAGPAQKLKSSDIFYFSNKFQKRKKAVINRPFLK
jgi:hypothetical protein